MSRGFNLFRLQQVDSQLDRASARLREIDLLLAEDEDVRAAQAAAEEAAEAADLSRRNQHTAETNTKTQRLKIEQTENRLYSGRVVNPKELQDLQQESAALKRYLETLEERQLDAMLAFEEAEAANELAARTFERVKASRIEQNAALNGERTRLLAETERLAAERAVALHPLSPEDRALYDRLRSSRAGRAVAEATNATCSACGSTLSAAGYQAARSPNQLAHCETCGRILYAG